MLAKIILSLFFLPSALAGTSPAVDVFFVQPGIEATADAYVVREAGSSQKVLAKNSDLPLPVASLTKLMTALVFLEEDVPMDKVMTLLPEDDRIGGKLYVYRGEEVSVSDLFYVALVGSANNATVALVRSTGLEMEEFVEKMNKKAKALGMHQTRFNDPTGLDVGNVGSAYDISLLVEAALERQEIRRALLTDPYEFETINTKDGHSISNTNGLLDSFLAEEPYAVLGGKTGYLDEAGYCLGIGAQQSGHKMIAVVLDSESSSARFAEAKALLFWAFESLYDTD